MSMLPSGKGKCDRCGQKEESTGIHLFLIVNDLDFETGQVVTTHYCRRKGCDDKIREAGKTS